MTLGVDYAWSKPNVTQMFDAGVRFAGRYFGAGTPDKRATRDEVLALNQAGIYAVSLVEGAARDMLLGYGTGQDHAKAAVRDLQAVGAPHDRPMYFSADWDVQATDWPDVTRYLAGAESVIGHDRVGIYGGYRAVELARERNNVKWLFQTYAWSDGRWYPPATLRQTHNHQWMAGDYVDLCWSNATDIGQWSLLTPERVEDMPVFVHVQENGGYYQYPQHKWFLSEDSVNAALAAYGLTRSDIISVGTLDYVRDVFGLVPGVDTGHDGHGNIPAGTIDQAAIQASAASGAKAGARGAITDDPQFAHNVATGVVEELGTLSGSLTLSGPIRATFGVSGDVGATAVQP